MKLKSSGQLMPTNIDNFDFIINKLPKSFFEDILLNEMELSEEFSIEKLMELISFYSQAREYYLQTAQLRQNNIKEEWGIYLLIKIL